MLVGYMRVPTAEQNHVTLPHAWGGGEVASADGLRFVVPVRTIHSGPNPRYFGQERGVTFYNLVSDCATASCCSPSCSSSRPSCRDEGRHQLARIVLHGKRGELRQRCREGQEDQLGAFGLVVNVIVLWNDRHGRGPEPASHRGPRRADEEVARSSPPGFDHINMLGRYAFSCRMPSPRASSGHSAIPAFGKTTVERTSCSVATGPPRPAHARRGPGRSPD